MLETYLKALLQIPKFKFVILLSQSEKFVGFMPSWTFEKVLNDKGQHFVDVLNGEDYEKLKLVEGVLTETVTNTDSNIEALNRMTVANLEAIVVIDEDKKLRGIVERDVIQSKLLLAMSKQN